MNLFSNYLHKLVNLITIDRIMLARLLCGIYCDYSYNKTFSIVARVYCITLGVVTGVGVSYTALMIYHNSWNAILTVSKTLIEYELCIFVPVISNGEHFFKIYNELKSYYNLYGHEVDADAVYSKLLFVAYVSIETLYFAWSWVMYDFSKYLPHYLCILCWLCRVGCGVYKFMRLILFELIWRRVKLFGKCFEYTVVSRTQVGLTRNNFRERVRRRLLEYKTLLELLSRSEVTLKIMMFVQTITAFLSCLFATYHTIKDKKYQVYISLLINQIKEVVLLTMPGIWVSLSASYIEQVQLLIRKQLFLCTDEEERLPLQDALSYLTLRPYKYTVWRMFSIDASMLLGLVGVLTTSVIILVQFTHAFD